jgi:hypothetical protein
LEKLMSNTGSNAISHDAGENWEENWFMDWLRAEGLGVAGHAQFDSSTRLST